MRNVSIGLSTMIIIRTLAISILCLSAILAHAQDNLRFNGAFESGQLNTAGSSVDGFFLHVLPDPQGDSDYVNVGQGGAGPNSRLDARVVRQEQVGSETILPRRGDFFFRGVVYFDKDYTRMAHNLPEGRNKPRFTLMMGHEDLRFDYDEEGYIGFSIYTPRNFEHELGVNGHRGESVLLGTNPNPRATTFTLSHYVDESHNEAHWWFVFNTSDSSTLEGGAATRVDLGPVKPDLGTWTDFVIRFRMNPFSVDTNPANKGIEGAKNQLYRANRGILQVWKAEGPPDANGNRRMALKLDLVNTPVGLVPLADDRIGHTFRIYKYGWHYNPTTVRGPIWYGYDEIRYGLVSKDGTRYSDVHPAGLPCEEGCPDRPKDNSGDVKPNPPLNLRAE